MAAASAWRFATNTPHRLSLRLTARLLRLPLKACLPVCWPGRPNRQGGVINRGDTRPSFLVQPSRLSGQAVVSRDGRVVRYQHPPPPQPSPDGSASATPPQGGVVGFGTRTVFPVQPSRLSGQVVASRDAWRFAANTPTASAFALRLGFRDSPSRPVCLSALPDRQAGD